MKGLFMKFTSTTPPSRTRVAASEFGFSTLIQVFQERSAPQIWFSHGTSEPSPSGKVVSMIAQGLSRIRAGWRLKNEIRCSCMRVDFGRNHRLIRAEPHELWPKCTTLRRQLRQTGKRHLSPASEAWLPIICLFAVLA